jgi:predicted dehydrogenase
MPNKLRLAFLGFRHGHVMSLYKLATAHPKIDVVAAAEEDAATVDALKSAGVVKLTHTNYDDVFANVPCDAIAVGDYFGRRGGLVLRGLRAGKHVIADKPVCTAMSELDQIGQVLRETGLKLGCLLDLRDNGPFRTARRLIREGKVGAVQTVTITAQHPLMYGKRPSWYFEDGKHGGTINDIGVHAVDLIPWLTGRKIVEATAARAWNARLKQHPKFQECAQMLLRLDNDGSVFGDLSYISPDGLGYAAPQYWRLTIHGDAGLIEAGYNAKAISLATAADAQPQQVPCDPETPGGVLESFLAEVRGDRVDDMLTTGDVLDAARRKLQIQAAADQRACNVRL